MSYFYRPAVRPLRKRVLPWSESRLARVIQAHRHAAERALKMEYVSDHNTGWRGEDWREPLRHLIAADRLQREAKVTA